MFRKSTRIYLDYASLTPIDPRVVREMAAFSAPIYANPSALHKEGVSAKKILADARGRIARLIHAHADEVICTSGGTEANNLAIAGAVESLREQDVPYESMHILISAIEHSSVLECANHLAGKGVSVETVAVNGEGVIDIADLKQKLRPSTVVVSVMSLNNEIGTIQPIREVAKAIRQARKSFGEQGTQESGGQAAPLRLSAPYPLLHTDAAQAFVCEGINTESLGADMVTLDGSKVYGPRGMGVLYAKRGTPLTPVMFGGGQERGMRSGTENLPGIAGFALALEIAESERQSERQRLSGLRDVFVREVSTLREGVRIYGSEGDRQSPHIANISIPGIDNEYFILRLDALGIACSTKSSCLRDEDESYVLKAIGGDSHTSVRFSFGRGTTERELRKAIAIIRAVLEAPY